MKRLWKDNEENRVREKDKGSAFLKLLRKFIWGNLKNIAFIGKEKNLVRIFNEEKNAQITFLKEDWILKEFFS